MFARILVPLCWTLWSALLVVLLYWLVAVLTERTSSPEARRGLGIFAVLSMMALLGVAAVFLTIAVRKQSSTGLIVMALLLAWPLVSMIAHPAIIGYKERRFAKGDASVGDFSDPALSALAHAVRENDGAALRRLLAGQAPPHDKDRAGNDLLAYALVLVRDRQGSAEPVRVLLDAGADPRASRAANGDDLVTSLVRGSSSPSAAVEALGLPLEHGADPNAVERYTGSTPIGIVHKQPEMLRLLVAHGADIDRLQSGGVPAVVGLIGTRQWESALYLIEKGANLDVKNEHGVSVDYYLNEWKDSVFGEHPEGWDKVREAIARRRAGRP